MTTPSCSGSPKDKIKAGYRSWKEGEHAIFYRTKDHNTIEIIRLLGPGMEIERHLSRETPREQSRQQDIERDDDMER